MMEFRILKKSKKTRARLGILKTAQGEAETPTLVGVATQAVIKTLTSEEVKQTKTQILISNTFHLHLKPGEKIVKANGGLHKFMNWDRPIMTDSGGFQVFSLGFGRDYKIGKMLTGTRNRADRTVVRPHHKPKGVKIARDGVYFRSPVDGRELFLGPKESIKIQKDLGADIAFAFDECPPPIANKEYIIESVERTHRWAKESLTARSGKRQALYGIIQGGKYKDLRIKSSKFISSLPFDGFGVGGELGFDKKEMFQMIKWVTDELPQDKPRHLLGNGHLSDLRDIFKGGVDTVDCIIPTHYARHGTAFINPSASLLSAIPGTSGVKVDFNKAIFLKDKRPIDKNCGCAVCKTYSRSYIAHLYRAKEITAMRLLTFHNLYFFNSFVEEIREEIKKGRL